MRGIYLKDNNNNKCLVAPYYRVGDLFLTTNATNPSNYLGGKWELFGPGRVLVCVDTSNSNFNIVKKTGGAATHTHTQGATGSYSGTSGSTKLTIDQIPSHKHPIVVDKAGVDYGLALYGANLVQRNSVYVDEYMAQPVGGGKGHTHSIPSHTHTNPTTASSSSLQPFITCYVWIRTA